ncbi:MAG TPA: hypothetical protein VFH51_03050, partial [Myxococcota bacterium]|nr:hypothetical protein [Myxococcota bacterium]
SLEARLRAGLTSHDALALDAALADLHRTVAAGVEGILRDALHVRQSSGSIGPVLALLRLSQPAHA